MIAFLAWAALFALGLLLIQQQVFVAAGAVLQELESRNLDTTAIDERRRKVVDYQDLAYGGEYLDRLKENAA